MTETPSFIRTRYIEHTEYYTRLTPPEKEAIRLMLVRLGYVTDEKPPIMNQGLTRGDSEEQQP